MFGNKDIVVRELEHIADLLDEGNDLDSRMSNEYERFEKEFENLNDEFEENARAYQKQRSEALAKFKPDITALTPVLPAAIEPPIGLKDSKYTPLAYRRALVEHDVKISQGEQLTDKIKKIGKSAIFFSWLSVIGVALILLVYLMGQSELIDRLIDIGLDGVIGFIAFAGIVLIFVGIRKGKDLRKDYEEGIKSIQECKEYSDQYKKDLAARKAKLKEIAAEFEKVDRESIVAELIKTIEGYDKEYRSMVSDCDTMFECMSKAQVVRLQTARSEHEEKIEKISQRLEANQAQLSAVTLLNPDMFDRARQIAEAIRRGRADTVKEAINIVLDDERRAEEEAQRRREAAARQAILERQAADNRRHNEEMERTAARQAAEAKRHNDEMERSANARAEADKQERIRMAQKRCRNCAHVMECPVSVSYRTQSTGAVCPSFVPSKR